MGSSCLFSSVHFKDEDQGQPVQPVQPEVQSRLSYGSMLMNFGKCLLLIIVVPPFLNYASLQREGQVLMPKGNHLPITHARTDKQQFMMVL